MSSIDLSQFHAGFFDEVEEHLGKIESELLGLDVNDPGNADFDGVFRAAHSIKGGAGTFGFSEMAKFTHVLESVMDRLRHGELAITFEMVDIFLRACDVLRAQLSAYREGTSAGEVSTRQSAGELEVLQQAQPSGSGGSDAAAAPPMAQQYTIALSVTDSGEARGANYAALCGALAEMGALRWPSDQTAQSSAWRFTLQAIVSEENLRDLLGFIIDEPGDIQITVGPVSGSGDAGAPGATGGASAAASGDGFGFFDASPGAPEAASAASTAPEAFGFFDASPGAPEAASASSAAPEAFGFFDASPGAPAVAASSGAPPGASEAFGFFTDAPGNPTASASASASPQSDASAAAAKAPGSVTELKPGASQGAGSQGAGSQGAAAKAPAAKAAAGNKDADSTIRVSLAKIDHLINLVGEMVIGQARLERVSSELDPATFHDLHQTVTQMQHNMRDLQQGVMSIRMLPLRFVFERFPRMVRELATKLNKVVKLQTSGDETVLDKVLIEQLADPLTHLIRNSLDHGIESPERRVAAGKSPEGTISLRAWHQGGEVMVELSDDGGGLNKDRILAKAAESGLPCSPDMPLREVWQLIFAPGFSTAETVTDVSGRGVGMDVVSKNITHIGGRVDIDSEAGYGTKVTIRLPLTLAILDGLSVVVGGEIYMIPLTNIIESLQPLPGAIRTVAGGGRIIHVRDEYFPIVTLSDVMPPRGGVAARAEDGGGILVLLEAGNGRVALLVDDLEGQHQVVIKSLETNFRHVPGISGATVMGNGRVALIIDVASFVRHAGARAAA